MSSYPFAVVVQIMGRGRETEVFELSLVDGRVVCDCDHHEQCAEVCDNVPQVGSAFASNLAQVYGVALETILETIATDIDNGIAPPFLEDYPS